MLSFLKMLLLLLLLSFELLVLSPSPPRCLHHLLNLQHSWGQTRARFSLPIQATPSQSRGNLPAMTGPVEVCVLVWDCCCCLSCCCCCCCLMLACCCFSCYCCFCAGTRNQKKKQGPTLPLFCFFFSARACCSPHQILVCGFYQKPPSDSDKQDKYMERRGLFGAAMEQVPNGFNVCSSCLKARCSPWQSYRDAFAQGQPIRFFGLKVGCQRLCCTFEQEFNALPLTHTSFLVVRFYSWALLVCCLSGFSLVRVQFLGKLAVTEEWPAHDVCCCNTQAIIATMALATTTVACANSLLFDSL